MSKIEGGEKGKRTVKKGFTTCVADRWENNKYKKEERVIPFPF